MPNPFDYMQLVSSDPERAKAFYSGLFDWQVEDTTGAGDMVQTIIRQPHGPWGGIMGASNKDVQSMWHIYVQVTDMDLALLRVSQLGRQGHRAENAGAQYRLHRLYPRPHRGDPRPVAAHQ